MRYSKLFLYYLLQRASAYAFVIAFVVGTSGCSWESAGTRKHLVFGFGVIETAALPVKDPNADACSVQRITALGLFLGPGDIVNGFMIGAAQRQSVIINPDAELLLDATSYSSGRFKVLIAPIRPSDPLPTIE